MFAKTCQNCVLAPRTCTHFKELSEADYAANPAWIDLLCITPVNQSVDTLTFCGLAIQYAVNKHLPYFVYPLQGFNDRNDDLLNLFDQSSLPDCCLGLFVVTGYCQLLDNTDIAHGYVNNGLGRLTKFFHTTPVPDLATKIAAFYAGTGPQKIFIPRPDYITITVPATPQHPSSVCVVATDRHVSASKKEREPA